MRTALTLGKFAPLHRGHQLLIERALAENDRVIVMIYDCPDVTRIPLPVRAGWIRSIYPAVDVIEAKDGPMEVGNTPEIRQCHEDYILATLAGRSIDAFYSSEFYGEHVSAALGAEDRRVDPDRVMVPVSGSAVREDPYAHRRFVDPHVYRDLITKVVLLGAPSTGKTTLAALLAEEYRTVWMPEYGREYWEANQVGRRLTRQQLVEIAEGHIEREERLVPDARRHLFVDTEAITTWVFSHYYHGSAQPRLEELAGQSPSRYDRFFLCGDEIPYDDTWDRSGDISRVAMQRMIRAELQARGVEYVELQGSVEERVADVRRHLRGLPLR